MKYNELNVTKKRSIKRVGRGISAGQGKTAGRGTKGQSSRTGSSRKPGFEGGQTPLMQKLPKLPGFRSIRPKAEVIYTGQLDSIEKTNKTQTIDNHVLAQMGFTSSAHVRVKLITKGEVTKKVAISLQGASASAIAAIEKAGGSFMQVEQVKRSKKTKPAK